MAITRLRELASSSLHDPHGVDFLDEETLVVGNRRGGVVVLRLPSVASDDGVEWVDPLGTADEAAADRPGSVRVDGRRAALVCNNWANTITRHTAQAGGGWTPERPSCANGSTSRTAWRSATTGAGSRPATTTRTPSSSIRTRRPIRTPSPSPS